jgi:peptide-methionine (S)-S-oxide reductase
MRASQTPSKTKIIAPAKAPPGREQASFKFPERHAVLGTPLEPPFPEGLSTAVFGLGCFWGADRSQPCSVSI